MRAESRTAAYPLAALHQASWTDVSRSRGDLCGTPSQFAYPAAVGDYLTSVLALLAIPAVATHCRHAQPLVWLFNVVGTLDLINAITLATVHEAAPFMDLPIGSRYFGPRFARHALGRTQRDRPPMRFAVEREVVALLLPRRTCRPHIHGKRLGE